jgi:hypothetical protein
MRTTNRTLAAKLATATLCVLAPLIACRRPHTPAPLAPELRGPVKDLAAVRAGDDLSLVWTMPTKGVRELAVNGRVAVRICWREATASPCSDVGNPLDFAPGAAASFSEMLPPPLSSGSPRIVYFFVELLNHDGHSTGLSNGVPTLAGAPPPPVEGFSAQVTPNGVLLRWTFDSTTYAIRIHRVRVVLRPQPSSANPDAPIQIPAPDERNLTIDGGSSTSQTLDREIRPGDTYLYTAQRVARFTIKNQSMELAGQFSNAVEVTASDATQQ